MVKTVTVTSFSCLALLSGGACLDGEPVAPSLATAALALELGVPIDGLTCVELAIGEQEPEARCVTASDARARFEAEVACDPGSGSVRARLWLSPLHELGFDAFYDPCGEEGCAFDLTCGTGPTSARLELAFRGFREFSPVSVATSSAWFFAGAATCQDIDGEDTPLMFGWGDEDGVRHPSALLQYVVARGFDLAPPEVLASTPVLVCGEVSCPLPHTDGVVASARCSDGHEVRYRTLSGSDESWLPIRYLSLLVDLESLVQTGHTDCQLNAAATFAGEGFAALGRADAFPVARHHLPLRVRDGAVACARATLDGYDEVDDEIVTVEYRRGWNLAVSNPGFALPKLCHTVGDGGLESVCE